MTENSSSSDSEEDSRFREVCDPTLWRTAATGQARGDGGPLVATGTDTDPQDAVADHRQSFVLLNRLKESLAVRQTKPTVPVASSKQREKCVRRNGKPGNSVGAVAVVSTLSPYLAKQLSARLDKAVDIHRSPQDDAKVRSADSTKGHPSFWLLKDTILDSQAKESSSTSQRVKRRVKTVKRLSYFNSSDEEEVAVMCGSVAVSPEWLMAGGEHCPWPHPKNVRYLEEYKLKERRPDGSIVGISCPLQNTNIAKQSRENGSLKSSSVTENLEKDIVQKKKVHKVCQSNLKNGLEEIADLKKRKQGRKRGKKKKQKLISDMVSTDV